MNARMRPADWTMLVALSILWGGAFFFTGIAVLELPPLVVVTGRAGFAAVALVVIVRLAGFRWPRNPGIWLGFLGMGALNGLIPYGLMAWGQLHISSGLTSILNSTTPLFSVVLTHFFTSDERMTANRVLGILLGIAGVAVLIGPSALRGLGLQGMAELAVLLGAFSYAWAAILGRRLRHLPSLVLAAGQIAGTFVLVLPISLWHDDWNALAPSTGTILAVLALSLLSTALAYILYFRLLASAGATNVLLVTLLIPLSALALGHLFLGEPLSWNTAAAMLLIFAGIGAVDGRLRLPAPVRS